ncbi:MAG TPA: ABC transporter permease, partial [Candidatus Angelobacter sp.]
MMLNRIAGYLNVAGDLRYALRTLRRNPAFTLAAVLTLALGIGANTAIFSVVDAYLLRPLPYRAPERLVVLWESTHEGGRGGVAMANYQDWLRQSTAFESLAAWSPMQVDMKVGDRTERVQGELATPNYLSLLGVAPQFGRDFGPQEQAPHPVVIVSDNFWHTRMGGRPDAVGSTILLGGTLFTIVGVLPVGFQGLSGEAEILTPIAAYNLMYPQLADMDFPHSRDVHFMRGIARLKPGVSLHVATAQMQAIGDRLAQQYPDKNHNRSVALAPAHSDMVRNIRPALRALLLAVALVLLVACTNVANLFLVRLSRRSQEIALRTALGATRWRLLRQLWSETILVSLAGTVLSLALFPLVRISLTSFLPLDLPRFTQMQFDVRLLLFAFVLTLVTGGVLAFLPMIQLRRSRLPQLKSVAQSGDARPLFRLRSLLATGEVALAVVLTVGSGLTIKS